VLTLESSRRTGSLCSLSSSTCLPLSAQIRPDRALLLTDKYFNKNSRAFISFQIFPRRSLISFGDFPCILSLYFSALSITCIIYSPQKAARHPIKLLHVSHAGRLVLL
jgi:hypothetical protein